MARTLLQLRTATRQRADMENSTFVLDAELNDYLNSSLAELYDMVIATYEDYFLNASTVTVASGANTIPFPVDSTGTPTVLKVRGVDYQIGGSGWVSLRPFQFSERNALTLDVRRAQYTAPQRTYRVGPTSIFLLPEIDASGVYRMWYIPTLTPLVADTDVLTLPQYWDEYAVCDAAIKCAQKEEGDVSTLMGQKAALIARINASARSRDAGEPPRVSDVRRDEGWPYGWWP